MAELELSSLVKLIRRTQELDSLQKPATLIVSTGETLEERKLDSLMAGLTTNFVLPERVQT